MDAQAIAYFMSSYKNKSFSKAAAEHYITQQALSKNITKLENDLGVALFERTSRGLEPTPAGDVFYGYACRMDSLADEARRRTREAAGIERAKLVVGITQATVFSLIPKLSARFSSLRPDVDIDFVEYTNSVEMFQDVIAGKVHVAPTAGNRHVREQGVYFVTAGYEVVHCAVDSDGPLATKASVTLEDLRGLGAQLPATGMMHWLDVLRQYIKEREPEIAIVVTSAGGTGMLQAMSAGFVAFGPASFCFPLQGKTYVPFEPPEGMDPLMSIDIAVHSPEDPVVKSFCDAARIVLRETPEQHG